MQPALSSYILPAEIPSAVSGTLSALLPLSWTVLSLIAVYGNFV